MSDKYFEEKAIELIDGFGKTYSENTYNIIKREVVFFLKEIARDQRYACVKSYFKNAPYDLGIHIESSIMNADIKEKR